MGNVEVMGKMGEKKEKSLGEMYLDTKIAPKLFQEILKIEDKRIDDLIKEKYKLTDATEKEDKESEELKTAYYNIKDVLKKYLVLDESYYNLLSVWVIGTYWHKEFESYPYLFINAMKGSGKTRLLKLMAAICHNGEVLASMKEAVLFRTNSTLAIDEFEALGRKHNEDLRELLNAAYKKGIKVKRMRKQKMPDGEQQVVEEFDVYRPIIMANIWGMEDVLSDRCFTLILERSNDTRRTKLVELFDQDLLVKAIKNTLNGQIVSKCRVVTLGGVYKEWNDYILRQEYNDTSTQIQNNTKQHFFNKINDSEINGRQLELSLPLLLIASEIEENVFLELLDTLKEMSEQKKEQDFLENKDVFLYDFISQEVASENMISLKEICNRFREFLQDENPEFLNEKWLGRALKRLKLIRKQKRMNYGRVVWLDYDKAKEKARMFK